MLPDQKTLLRVITSSFFHVYPHVPDAIHYLNFEGIRCFELPNRSNPWSNFVGEARLSAENADKVIQQVYDYFSADKRRFGWMVDDVSTPADLAQRLEKIGMRKSGSYAGMALLDMDTPINKNPAIQIRRATLDDASDLVALMDEAFGSGGSNYTLYEYSIKHPEHFFFMAYVEGVKNAVGLGRMYYFPDTDIVVMQDAVTTEAYRGRGIYSSLMAKRLEVAKQDGKVAAIMQADRTTSAPIAARMGFKEMSNLDFYVT